MPTYEFRCPDGTIIERIFKISEVPDAIPSPNGDGMATRIISGGAGLLFKGSGFYITDYGKDGKKDQRAAAGSEGKSSSTSDAGGAATSGNASGGASAGSSGSGSANSGSGSSGGTSGGSTSSAKSE